MEEKKEEQKEIKKQQPVSTNKDRYIPKADVEMMREDQYENYMYHRNDRWRK